MPFFLKNCLNCQNEFKARSQDINRGFGKFCSQSCSSIYNRNHEVKPNPNVICAYCNKQYYLKESKKKKSKSGLYFCSRNHKDLSQRIGGIKEIMPQHYGVASEYTYRRIAFLEKPKVCERCGYDKHEAAIIVHHKDRNRQNNDITNLEVLCVICHAIEHYENNNYKTTPLE